MSFVRYWSRLKASNHLKKHTRPRSSNLYIQRIYFCGRKRKSWFEYDSSVFLKIFITISHTNKEKTDFGVTDHYGII